MWAIGFAVENIGNDLADWVPDAMNFTLQATISGSSYTYDNKGCFNFFGDSEQLLPPGYTLRFSECFRVPQVASSLQFVVNSQASTPTVWNVDTEVKNPPAVVYPSSERSNLLALGALISQPNVRDVVLLSVQLKRYCFDPGPLWMLSFKMSLRNNTGHNDVKEPKMITVYDDQGNAYDPAPGLTTIGYGGGSPLNDVPPGLTHTAEDIIHLSSTSGACTQPNNMNLWPSVPKGLRLLVLLGTYQQVPQQWGVYDLGTVSVSPGCTNYFGYSC